MSTSPMNAAARSFSWRDRPWWNTSGVLVVLSTENVTIRGELISADLSGVTVLREGAELVWVDRRVIQETSLPGLMPAFSVTYRSTTDPMRDDVLEHLCHLSRFPDGIDAASLESLLGFTEQSEIRRVEQGETSR
jgi:hypothetical protein